MSSRDRDRADSTQAAPMVEEDRSRTAGKRSLTGALQRKANPTAWQPLAQVEPPGQAHPGEFASVLFDVQRAADGNGVTDGAEAAVAGAATGSGAPLPEVQREKFEASLGADLSGVRVHTGEPSQTAATSVGARAYTLGQDVHFGAGFYRPESTEGEHLLAHEVAHTVQQSGGAARTPMFKLDVSTPGDAHEVEADRAADAMVSGAHFAVTGSGGLARHVMREFYENSNAPSDNGPNGTRELSPDDWYLKPGLNWTTMATAAVEVAEQPVETLTLDNIVSSKPKGSQWAGVDWSESNVSSGPNSGMIPGWLWHTYGNYELTTVLRMTETAHGVTARQIKSYDNAKDEVKDGGLLGPAPTGENWALAKNGASSYADLANEQTVGTKSKVGDLFKTGNGAASNEVQGVDAKALGNGTDAEKTQVSKLLETARLADGKVGVATKAYAMHFSHDMTIAANDIVTATNDVESDKAKDEEEETLGDLMDAEKDKAAIKGGVASAISGYKWVADAIAKPEEAAKEIAAELAGEIAEEIFGGKYEARIAAAKSHMAAVKTKIKSLKDANLRIACENAQLKYEKVEAELPARLLDMQAALKARHDAYKAAAEAAAAKTIGKGADKNSGEQAERIQAAIEAIPRIDTVIGRAEAVIASVKLPRYNETAGVSLNVAINNPCGDKPGAAMFLHAIATLNAYKAKFEAVKKQWGDRKQSINALIGKLNVQGT